MAVHHRMHQLPGVLVSGVMLLYACSRATAALHSTQPDPWIGRPLYLTTPTSPPTATWGGPPTKTHKGATHPTWLCLSVAAPSSQAFPAVSAPHFCGTALQRSSSTRTFISPLRPRCLTYPSLLRVGRVWLPPNTRHAQFNQPLAFASKHNAVHPTPQIPSAGHMCQIDEKHDSDH